MKLALPEDVLLQVEKSARYIGNEVNSVIKDKNKVDIRFAFCFPDVYEIGMSNLGVAILYDMFNKREDIWCERVYSPWPDLHEIMLERNIPLFGLESQEPIREFDFLGMSLGYEMCYTNILGVLKLAQIPLRSVDRSEYDPIVLAGGPCTYNPMPISPFFDVFSIGEGEVPYHEFFDVYKECKALGLSRDDTLKKLSLVKGFFVPRFYEPKTVIERTVVQDMGDATYPLKPVIPHIQAAQDRMVLEIQRGCIRGCRFCQAGFTYRPNREKPASVLLDHAHALMDSTGYDEISLSSLSSSDYKELPLFLNELMDSCDKLKINISLPSLRIDAFSLDVMSKIGDVRKTTITFAPEAGSQRMRDIINKNISREDIMRGAEAAFRGGWTSIKLYFMLGLPFETDEDVTAIADIAEDLAMLYFDTVPKPERKGRVQITVSTSFFVPKPFTPFQWAEMQPEEEYKRKARLLKETIKNKVHARCISYQWHQPDVTLLEGVFARGDEKVADVIETAFNKGCLFDAWGEYFQYDKWLESFKECGVNMDDYTIKPRNIEETLPWDFIDMGVTRKFFEREWGLAKSEVTTPNCREKCSGCGCAKYESGVCLEHKN